MRSEVKSTMHVYRVDFFINGRANCKEYITDSPSGASDLAYFEFAEGENVEYEEDEVVDEGQVTVFKESFIKKLWTSQGK